MWQIAHPLLVKFSLTYHYVTGSGGPYFKQDFTITPDGVLTRFHIITGQCQENIYIGTTAAGGEGDMIDYNQDGKIDVRFNKSCQFILQLEDDQVTAAKVDRPVTMQIEGKVVSMEAYHPISFEIAPFNLS